MSAAAKDTSTDGAAGVAVRGSNKGPRSEKIPSLDGLRSASILLVFAAHAGADGRLNLGGGHSVKVPGALGVTVFFFLSGYLITTLLRREFETTQSIDFKAFYLRRLLRIFPPLYAVIALVLLLCGASVIRYEFTLTQLIAACTQIANYWMIHWGFHSLPPGLGVLWSLAVEEHFYLVFPVLYLVLLRVGLKPLQQALAIWMLCAVFLAWRFVLVLMVHASADHLMFSTDTRFDSILFGCALAVWGNPAVDPTRIPKFLWTWVLFPIGILALTGSHLIPDQLREASKYTVQGIGLVPVFCAVVRYPNWGPFKILNLKPVVFLGVVSYSFYLIHSVLLDLVERFALPGNYGAFIYGFPASLLAACLMHWLIELPSNRLRHRMYSSRSPMTGAGLEATKI